jgi:hypothetical protein
MTVQNAHLYAGRSGKLQGVAVGLNTNYLALLSQKFGKANKIVASIASNFKHTLDRQSIQHLSKRT